MTKPEMRPELVAAELDTVGDILALLADLAAADRADAVPQDVIESKVTEQAEKAARWLYVRYRSVWQAFIDEQHRDRGLRLDSSTDAFLRWVPDEILGMISGLLLEESAEDAVYRWAWADTIGLSS